LRAISSRRSQQKDEGVGAGMEAAPGWESRRERREPVYCIFAHQSLLGSRASDENLKRENGRMSE
jgi:hypothetical protein